MAPIRNKYLLAIAAGALLAGSTLWWLTRSSGPLAGDGTVEREPPGSVISGESAAQEPRTPSSTSAGNNPPSAQSSIDRSPGDGTTALQSAEPSDAVAATVSSNTSNAEAAASTDSSPPTLSPLVFEIISEVQSLQQAGLWEEALNEMNALYIDLELLTPFEQATLLNFYTNTLARLEMWQESITAFNLILQVPDLRPDLNARALLALGQLHAREGETQEGIAYLQEWLVYTSGMENMATLAPRVNVMLACLESDAGSSSRCTF